MKLSAKKLAKMKRDAEHVQKLRDMGAQGNVAYVFVDPKDLLELLRAYQATSPAMTIAAEDWIEIRLASPMPGRNYLVAARGAGVVMDVAFFAGPRPSGGLWWTMADIEIPSSAITHFASLNEPL